MNRTNWSGTLIALTGLTRRAHHLLADDPAEALVPSEKCAYRLSTMAIFGCSQVDRPAR